MEKQQDKGLAAKEAGAAMKRRAAGGMGGGLGGSPAAPPPPASRGLAAPADAREDLDLERGVASAAQATPLGELFEYAIKTPVTIARQKSAMLPIVSAEVQGTKVSIYHPEVHPKHPLNGYRLKNTTPLHLMQGPIPVFDAGTYAGDARIEDLAPGQERLLSLMPRRSTSRPCARKSSRTAKRKRNNGAS
jgi:hypothetical protein